ncbi:MAG: glycosyltransferase family 39 protein, partial [Vicinamibacterales bacterium]|nr:glycosyltransferase family 39 protein [Vicinamibacterales bacterium]
MIEVVTRRHHAILALILSAGLLLNTYGMTFGLPHRWIVDETVAEALRVGAERSLIWGDVTQTHFHTYLMTGVLAPYALYAQATRPDFGEIRRAAAVSWNELARVAPDFATRVTLIGRFFSALIGVATVFVVYLLGRRLFGVRAGLMAAAFLALSQGVVGSNHLARSEPLVGFLGALVLYLLVRALDSRPEQRRMFLTASFFTGLAFATKYNGLILVGSVGLTWLMLAWQDAGAGSPADRWRRLAAVVRWRWVPSS